MSGAEQSIVSGRQSRAEQTDDFVDQDTRADVVSVERCFSPVFGDSRYIERRGTCHQLWIQYQLFIRYSIPYGTSSYAMRGTRRKHCARLDLWPCPS